MLSALEGSVEVGGREDDETNDCIDSGLTAEAGSTGLEDVGAF